MPGWRQRERAEARATGITDDAGAHAERRLILRAQGERDHRECGENENRSQVHGTGKIQTKESRYLRPVWIASAGVIGPV